MYLWIYCYEIPTCLPTNVPDLSYSAYKENLGMKSLYIGTNAHHVHFILGTKFQLINGFSIRQINRPTFFWDVTKMYVCYVHDHRVLARVFLVRFFVSHGSLFILTQSPKKIHTHIYIYIYIHTQNEVLVVYGMIGLRERGR